MNPGKVLFPLLLTASFFAASPSSAQSGIDVAWDDCAGSGSETYTKTVDCSDQGAFDLVCSFATPVDVPGLGAVSWTLDVLVQGFGLPSWWQGDHGRYAMDIQSAGSSCPDQLWKLSRIAPTGIGPIFTQTGPNRFRLKGDLVFMPGDEPTLKAKTPYYSQTIQLRFGSGTSGDAGCQASACIVMSAVELQSTQVATLKLTEPLSKNYVTWRSPTICPEATTAKKQTWGEIKAFYR